jgi:hypothetical protein
MRNVTLSLVSLSFYSALTGKQTVEVKWHLQNILIFGEQIHLSLTFDFFVPVLIAMTRLSPS